MPEDLLGPVLLGLGQAVGNGRSQQAVPFLGACGVVGLGLGFGRGIV